VWVDHPSLLDSPPSPPLRFENTSEIAIPRGPQASL
jgi:hypothetical protein